MNYLQNHIWCSDSNWGGQYDCRHLVSLTSYEEHDKEDYDNIIDPKAEVYVDQEELYRFVGFTDEQANKFCTRDVANLKPEVISWLELNVKDRPEDNGITKGWVVYSKKHRAADSIKFSIFFHRKSDAMLFIRKFSKWEKPVSYIQYFTDVRKVLDLETNRYV